MSALHSCTRMERRHPCIMCLPCRSGICSPTALSAMALGKVEGVVEVLPSHISCHCIYSVCSTYSALEQAQPCKHHPYLLGAVCIPAGSPYHSQHGPCARNTLSPVNMAHTSKEQFAYQQGALITVIQHEPCLLIGLLRAGWLQIFLIP